MAEGSVITEKGRALLGKILATNSTLNITGAQIGSGDLPAGTPPASMTALASYVMDATIVAISTPAAGEVKVVLQVLSNDVETAFLAKEVALLASDPDEGDVVYCYVPMQDDPVQMRAAGDVVGKLLTMEISMIVSNVANVTAVIINHGGAIMRHDQGIRQGEQGHGGEKMLCLLLLFPKLECCFWTIDTKRGNIHCRNRFVNQK